MAKLEIVTGPQAGTTFALPAEKEEFIIGRSPTNAIVLVDMNASREHARIIADEDTFILEDMRSSNGTFHNGIPVQTQILLNHGDQIKIGGTVFRFDESQTIFTSRDIGAGSSLQNETEDFGQSFVQMLDEDSSGNMDLVLDEDESLEESLDRAEETSEAYQRAQKKLKVLYGVSEDIGTILDRSEVLEKIMDAIFEVFSQIDRGFMMLEDPETGEMIPEVIRKRGAEEGEQIKLSVSKTIIETAFKEKKSILSSDAMDDDRFTDGMSIVNFQIRSMMCSPLFVGDEKLGVIHVDTMDQTKRFTPDDLSLLQGIGRQAAISIKNANLVEAIEEETQRRNNLQRFLSPDFAERVLTGEIDLKLGGDEKFGTVFFSDIIGFTRMSSLLKPEVVVAKINRYFNKMVSIVFQYNGIINKFGGDSIMALWGLTASEDDYSPQLASIESSIEMHNALFDFNYALIEEGQKPIQMGVGLNTGRFLAGNVGSEQQMEYTVIGDTVNLASRIEAKAARGQIYISESTYNRVRERIYAIQMDPTYVKGKEEPVQVYSVKGFRDREFNDAEADRLTIPVSFVDEDGTKHNGLLISISGKKKKVRLHAHFRKLFEKESSVSFNVNIPEMKDPGEIECLVEEYTLMNPDEGKFYEYTLSLEKASPVFNTLILKGELLRADVAVDDIKRE